MSTGVWQGDKFPSEEDIELVGGQRDELLCVAGVLVMDGEKVELHWEADLTEATSEVFPLIDTERDGLLFLLLLLLLVLLLLFDLQRVLLQGVVFCSGLLLLVVVVFMLLVVVGERDEVLGHTSIL